MRSLGTVLLALGVASGACGGTTKSAPSDAGPAGGSASSDAGTSGAPTGGSVAGQSIGGAGTGGSASTGGSSPVKPLGGSSPTEPAGGSSGSGGAPGALACDEPSGGPRSDGPEPILGACEAIRDEVLVQRFSSYADRVPKGFFYDAGPWRGLWAQKCSVSPEETAEWGVNVGMVGVPVTFTTPWFYEASFCELGPRESARSFRCDYFDFQKLTPHTPENLAFLASALWWAENQNRGDRAQLGYSVAFGDAADWVEMCTLSGTFGDFGLCDEIRLERTTHSITYAGTVRLGEPELVRTIQGACH